MVKGRDDDTVGAWRSTSDPAWGPVSLDHLHLGGGQRLSQSNR